MERYGSSRRYSVICAMVVLSGLLISADRPAAMPAGYAQFEEASVDAPADSNCMLHPEGDQGRNDSLRVYADEDSVIRFLAVRPTLMQITGLRPIPSIFART
jgi:hypothetical protein